MSDERLGSWVVLRRLADDLLGPTWRLAQAETQGGVARLALARAFTGVGLTAESRNLAAVVDHPFVATTADLFDHQGQCVVAWEYSSGHSLREILERANDRMMPLSPGLCLLIAERVAQGLAAAAQRQVEGTTLHHGLLRPELVWITNDGEVKILGFEVGRALVARLATSPAFGPFIAPEVRAGSPIEARDDVYSLAAVLHAAITGIDPPSHDADRAAEQATSADDGAPLPAALTRLLVSCLGPRAGRPADPAALHDALREISIAAPRRVGPFELAYAIHGLFGDEIATEAKELERGGRPEAPRAQSTPKEASAPQRQPAPQPTVMARATEDLTAPSPGPRRPSWLPIAAGLAVVAIGAAVVLTRKPSDSGAPAAAAQPAAATAPAAAPTGPTPEELQAQIRALVEQRTGAVAAELRDQQEAEIKALQEQLAATQAATVTPEPSPRPAATAPPATTTAPSATGSAPATPPPAAVAPTTGQPAATPAASSPPAATTSSAAAPAPTRPAATPPATSSPAPATPATAAPAPRNEPAAQSPEPRPAATAAAPSAIATPGPGVVPPTMLTFAKPEYPLLARRTKVQGTVILSILVDEQGRATDIKFLKRVEQDVGLNEAAEKAARASTWRPATRDGKPVKMWFTLPVPFALE